MNKLGKNLYDEIYTENDKGSMYLLIKYGANSKARTTKNGYVGMLFAQKTSRAFRRQFEPMRVFYSTIFEELN